MLSQTKKGAGVLVLAGSLLLSAAFGEEKKGSEEKPLPAVSSVESETKSAILKSLEGVKKGWRGDETTNFVIYSQGLPEKEVQETAARIEKLRSELRAKWFDVQEKDDTQWKPKCDVHLFTNVDAYEREAQASRAIPGVTTIKLENERVVLLRIDLLCIDKKKIAENVIPHELMHAILADGLKKLPPRWGDEGVAMYCERAETRERRISSLSFLRERHGLFTVDQLFSLKDYPDTKYHELFYAQSAKLIEELVKEKSESAVISLLRDGSKEGYPKALKKHFNLESRDLDERMKKSIPTPAKKPMK